jgi:hypothetical protein
MKIAFASVLVALLVASCVSSEDRYWSGVSQVVKTTTEK